MIIVVLLVQWDESTVKRAARQWMASGCKLIRGCVDSSRVGCKYACRWLGFAHSASSRLKHKSKYPIGLRVEVRSMMTKQILQRTFQPITPTPTGRCPDVLRLGTEFAQTWRTPWSSLTMLHVHGRSFPNFRYYTDSQGISHLPIHAPQRDAPPFPSNLTLLRVQQTGNLVFRGSDHRLSSVHQAELRPVCIMMVFTHSNGCGPWNELRYCARVDGVEQCRGALLRRDREFFPRGCGGGCSIFIHSTPNT
jgi:hypothetical protein